MAGATNWQAPSYDPISGRLYIAFREAGDTYFKEPQQFEAGKPYWGGKTKGASEKEWAGIKSIDPQTGKSDWEFKLVSGSLSAGVLATAGGIVLAASQEGNLIALDSRTGRFIWRFQVGAAINSSPMSYAIEGQQFIALSAGKVLYAFALPQEETKPQHSVIQSRLKSKVSSSPKLLGVEIGQGAE